MNLKSRRLKSESRAYLKFESRIPDPPSRALAPWGGGSIVVVVVLYCCIVHVMGQIFFPNTPTLKTLLHEDIEYQKIMVNSWKMLKIDCK